MMPRLHRRQFLATLAAAPALSVRAAEKIEIIRDPKLLTKPIPIALEGFSGEAEAVLRFDLEVMGFEIVSGAGTQFRVIGSNNGAVQGKLFDAVAQRDLFALRRYTGGSLRRQAHALSDDVVFAATGVKGIAQTQVAFKNDTGKTSEIVVCDYDGANTTRVTSDNSIVAAPNWKPGQRMLYYTSYKLGNADILRHDLASGQRYMVARYSGTNTAPAVSPDGSRVAMILSKAGAPNVWVAAADGTNPRRLTTSREGESSPCWSPDNRTVCFSSRTSGRSALYTVSADGGAMKRLSTGGVLNATEPDWSPDGKTIVFTAQMGDFQICVVPAGGGAAVTVTAGEDPCWAANSRTVMFARRVGGGRRVLSLLDVPTRRVKDLKTIPGSCSQPGWAR